MAEILTIGGIAFLAVNGPFTFFLFRFLEKLDDPKYEEKVFKKKLQNKNRGNSKKN